MVPFENLPGHETDKTGPQLKKLGESCDKTQYTGLCKKIDYCERNVMATQRELARKSLLRFQNAFICNDKNLKNIEACFPPNLNPLEDKKLQQILEALRTNPPTEQGEAPAKELQRYIKAKIQRKDELRELTYYQANSSNIMDDLKFIETLKKNYPQSKTQLQQIQCALSRYLEADPMSFAEEATVRAQKNSPANKAMVQMGKFGAVFVLGAGTILSGVMCFARKEFSVAPLLYGGGLLAMINPGLFQGKSEKQAQEAVSVLGNPAFLTLAKKYNMAGTEWEEFILGLSTRNSDIAKILKQKKTWTGKEGGMRKDIIEAMGFKAGTVEQKNFYSLLCNEKDFRRLAGLLGTVSDKEVSQLIGAYVKEGAWKHAGPGCKNWMREPKPNPNIPLNQPQPMPARDPSAPTI